MEFDALREMMVKEQIIARGIKDIAVIEAMFRVPRHLFVHLQYVDSAYRDHPLPVGEGQTISQPYIVALMSECLGLDKQKTVLEIGTGSGYQTAILAEISKKVYSVERIAFLAEKAKKVLSDLDYKNVEIEVGDGSLGLSKYAPYDAIMVTASAPQVPPSLLEQLNDNGCLVIPIGETFSQTLTLVQKKGKEIISSYICGCVFVPLLGREGWPDKKN